MRLTALLVAPYLASAFLIPTFSRHTPRPQDLLAIDRRLAEGHDTTRFPSWHTTHLLARRLFALSDIGTLATIFQPSTSPKSSQTNDDALAGNPIVLPEYYADCVGRSKHKHDLLELVGEGNPVLLAFNIGTAFRNAAHGSNVSLEIDWWRRPKKHLRNHRRHHRKHRRDDDDDDGDDEDLIRGSLAGLPRLSLLGHIEPLTNLTAPQRNALESCFLDRHRDVKLWLPGHEDAIHGSYWTRLVVEKVFWVGGFGDRARIGWLDPELWHDITKKGAAGAEEKGWASVRLPGEKQLKS